MSGLYQGRYGALRLAASTRYRVAVAAGAGLTDVFPAASNVKGAVVTVFYVLGPRAQVFKGSSLLTRNDTADFWLGRGVLPLYVPAGQNIKVTVSSGPGVVVGCNVEFLS